MFDNPALWIMGLIFMSIGIVNKDKWKENHTMWKNLTQKERTGKLTLVIGRGILFVIGIIFYLFYT